MFARTALFAAFNVLALALAPPIPAGVKAAPSQAPAQFEVASVKAKHIRRRQGRDSDAARRTLHRTTRRCGN
jgi:hypothetical protein